MLRLLFVALLSCVVAVATTGTVDIHSREVTVVVINLSGSHIWASCSSKSNHVYSGAMQERQKIKWKFATSDLDLKTCLYCAFRRSGKDLKVSVWGKLGCYHAPDDSYAVWHITPKGIEYRKNGVFKPWGYTEW